jgi:hypothetical protein
MWAKVPENAPVTMCWKCGEYEAVWFLPNYWTGQPESIVCKYCHVEKRGLTAPVPEYLKEEIPLDD